MRRLFIFIVAVLSMFSASAQYVIPDHEGARYSHMNLQGVWNIGLGISPVVSISHPVASAYGGGNFAAGGIFGLSVEAGWFWRDNCRVAVELSRVDNSYANMFTWNGSDARKDLSAWDITVTADYHWHRWSAGAGLSFGATTLKYTAADVAEGGVNDARFGSSGFNDRSAHFGLAVNGSYLVSPFLKLEAFYRPSLFAGGKMRYTHTLGAQIKIYFPFIEAVVCK